MTLVHLPSVTLNELLSCDAPLHNDSSFEENAAFDEFQAFGLSDDLLDEREDKISVFDLDDLN